MKRSIAALAAVLAFVLPVSAAVQTVTLAVPGMTCSTCPLTVKHSLAKVPGVRKAKVSHEEKEGIVTFDDTKVNVETLLKATKEAGYPSTVKQ